MADKSKTPRKSAASRDQTEDSARDAAQNTKGSSASNNLEGWLRSKELQPPG